MSLTSLAEMLIETFMQPESDLASIQIYDSNHWSDMQFDHTRLHSE